MAVWCYTRNCGTLPPSMRLIFLDKPCSEWVASNSLAFAIRDAFPVSDGHTLVIPRRLVVSWREATDEERTALMSLVDVVTHDLEHSHAPDGFNVGFNDGTAAGQTVPTSTSTSSPATAAMWPIPAAGSAMSSPTRGTISLSEPHRWSPVALPPSTPTSDL